MELLDRIDDRDGDAGTVSEEEVLRYWLAEEVAEEREEGNDGDEKEGNSLDPEAIAEKERLLDELTDRKPLAEDVFAEGDTEWYRLDLREEELRALTVVKGPSGEGWRSVAENGRIESVARKIEASEDVEALNEGTEKDLEKVVGISRDLPSKEEMEELIVVGEPEEGEDPWIADGNHRAVARVLHAIEREEYTKQIAYVGVDGERPGE